MTHLEASSTQELVLADFTPEALKRAAEAKAGHADYGSDTYHAGLEALLYSISHEAQLNTSGLREVWNRIVAALANRLTLVAWETANPALAHAPVGSPLFILGLGRTGSSILHETLAAAPGMRTPLTWQTRDLALVRRVADARTDDRVRQIDEAIARKNQLIEGYAAIHYEDAHVPMECVALSILNMVSVQFATIAWMPTYRRFLATLDARETYGWHRRALRYLQANKPRKQWVLKAPMHSLYIDALMDSYPDAKIIQTHRSPIEVIGSMASLYRRLRQPWSYRTDVDGQAAADADYTAEGVRRSVRYRRDHPEFDARVCDVSFKASMADQQGVLGAIYRHFGFDFTDEARRATLAYLSDRPRGKHGSHDYSLEAFGLRADQIQSMFGDYQARFAAYL